MDRPTIVGYLEKISGEEDKDTRGSAICLMLKELIDRVEALERARGVG
jgi:hypothetical protein